MKTEDLKGDRNKGTGLDNGQDGSVERKKEEIVRYGISAAPGIVVGPAFVIDSAVFVVPHNRIP